MALAEGTKEVLYLRNICASMGITVNTPTHIYCDNQGSIALADNNAERHDRSKHIDIRYHFVKEQTDIRYQHIGSNDNLADILTKPLTRVQHQSAIRLLQIEGAY